MKITENPIDLTGHQLVQAQRTFIELEKMEMSSELKFWVACNMQACKKPLMELNRKEQRECINHAAVDDSGTLEVDERGNYRYKPSRRISLDEKLDKIFIQTNTSAWLISVN